MRKNSIILYLILIVLAVSACTPDPRKQAQADAIQEQAQQDALNQAQQRAQSDDLHKLDVQQQALEQANREATAAEWRRTWNNIILYGGWVSVAMVCVLIVFSTRTIVQTIEGVGQATILKATITAGLIHLDHNGNYPALVTQLGGGKWSLTDPNTDSVLLLDVRNPGDAQKIAGAIAIRHSFALADEARRSSDAGVSISNIQPPIIHPQIIDVSDVRSLIEGGRDE